MKNIKRILPTILLATLSITGFSQCPNDTNQGLDSQEFEVGQELKIPNLYVSSPVQSFSEMGLGLQKVVEFINNHPELTLEIAAHTEMRGQDDYNQRISNRYIELVKKYLSARYEGVAQKIQYGAYGEAYPIINQDYLDTVDTDMEKERLHKCNSRVVLKIIDIEEPALEANAAEIAEVAISETP